MFPHAAAVWLHGRAPFCLLAHDTAADPRFVHANRAAQVGTAERAERIAIGAREETRSMGGQIGALFRLEGEIRQLRGEGA